MPDRPDRLVELLLKGVRQLPQDEQDSVLGTLLANAVPALTPAPGTSEVAVPALDPWQIDIPNLTHTVRAQGRPVLTQPLGTLDALGGSVPTDPDTELKVLPVRLPVADYDRLRAFSREHGFSMAVIIRTLVERFLDERGARPDDDPPG
jgi:hypothetical protein